MLSKVLDPSVYKGLAARRLRERYSCLRHRRFEVGRVITFYEFQVKPKKVVVRLGSQSARGSRYVFSESEILTDKEEREAWLSAVGPALKVNQVGS